MHKERVDVGADLADLIQPVHAGRVDTVAIGLLHADEVVTLIDGEYEERIVSCDSGRSEANEKRREGIVVRLQLIDIALGAGTKGDMLIPRDAVKVVRVGNIGKC